MSARSAAVTVKLNRELLADARTSARRAGQTFVEFVSEVIETSIASRRLRELPPQPVADPSEKSKPKPLPRGVDPLDLHGAVDTYRLILPGVGDWRRSDRISVEVQ